MVLINNSLTALADLFAGFQNGRYNIRNAPFSASKLTQLLKALAGNPSNVNIAFLACIRPTESKFSNV
jgi:hypothetical protein